MQNPQTSAFLNDFTLSPSDGVADHLISGAKVRFWSKCHKREVAAPVFRIFQIAHLSFGYSPKLVLKKLKI